MLTWEGWPPVGQVEVGCRAWESRDTPLTIAYRVGLALWLARDKQRRAA